MGEMMKTLLIFLLLTVQAFAATTTSTGEKVLMGQKGSSTNITLEANTNAAAGSKPRLIYDKSAAKWKISHDGTTSTEVGSNSGVTAISALDINWASGNVFTKTLAANSTFTFSNQVAGQVIVVRLTNTASNYTVTWPVGVLWSGGVAPTQTIGAKSDIYTFVYDGTTTFGSVVQNF